MALNQMHDRCDASTAVTDDFEQPMRNSCRAEALVQVQKSHLDLIFCGHHFNQYEAELFLQGFDIIDDQRGKFLSKQEMLVGSEN